MGNWDGCGEQTRRLGRLGVKAIILEHLQWDPATDGNRAAKVPGRRDSHWVGEGRGEDKTPDAMLLEMANMGAME